jgi:hypothetical protein
MKKIILLLVLAAFICIPAFAQKAKPKTKSVGSGSTFEMTIERDGQKTEIKWTQFQSADGNAVNADKGRVNLFYGASNSNDEKSFMFNGWVPAGETGTFTIGSGPSVGFSAQTSLLSNVPIFMPDKGGTVTIDANPTQGGFVTGTFQGVCKNVTDAGTVEEYKISGSFKLARP